MLHAKISNYCDHFFKNIAEMLLKILSSDSFIYLNDYKWSSCIFPDIFIWFIVCWNTADVSKAALLENCLSLCWLGHSLRDDYHGACAVLVFRTASLKSSCCREISMGIVKELYMSSHLMEGEKVLHQHWDSKDDGQICPLYPLRLNHNCAFKATLTVKGLTCPGLFQGTVFFNVLCFTCIMLSLLGTFG